jgi:uncharacterized OB-fold protein
MPRFSSRCPHCGQYVIRNTKFCRKCGLELERCNWCSSINPWFADYCHNCGSHLATTDDKEEGEMQKVVYVDEQNLNPLDEALLAIIKLRDGTISLSEVSSMLGVTKTSLTQSIDRLQQSHLIEKSQR